MNDNAGIGFSWTKPKVEEMVKLYQEGLSASKIATAIGAASRNAVIGKINRLGLGPRSLDTVALNRPRSKKKLNKGHKGGKFGGMQPVTLAPKAKRAFALNPAPLPPEIIDVPPDARKRLLDLDAHDCRWPLGDPKDAEFGFCGAVVVAGLPYCEGHTRRAFAPPQAKALRTLPVACRRDPATGVANASENATTPQMRKKEDVSS